MKTFCFILILFFSHQSYSLPAPKKGDRCEKNFVYDIYLSIFKMGDLHRTVKWKDQKGSVSTTSSVDVLGIGTTYQQLTHFYWSEEQQSFLTQDFQQIMTGFKSRTILAKFIKGGTKSTISLNNEISHFDNKDKHLLDLDTLGEQIRFNVINKVKTFKLYRQASDDIQLYQFEIVGLEKLETKKWGVIDSILVQQTGKNEDITLWFAPELDYQMVKVENNGLMNSSAHLVEADINCNSHR